jgi:glycosyltransferase involved in cell wall biosynthesis
MQMRVLHVGCLLDPHARRAEALLEAWPTLGAVAEAVAGAGAEVVVLHAAHRDEVVERGGVTYHFVAESPLARVPGTRTSAGVLPFRLLRAAAALRPDVVHLHGLAFPIHARALARLGRPLLVQDHADRPPARGRVPVHRWGFARVAATAFTAREQAAPFHAAGLLPASARIFEIPESSSRFSPGDQAAARAATGVHGEPALLWVGRLDGNKDPLTILDALARAAPRLPDPHLWCCFTDAPLLGAVRARIATDPRLAGRVHLLGRVPHEEVEALCRAADFLLLGSEHESCGYAVVEALACGATPILSDIPPFRALTGGGAVGALVPRGDAEGFAEALVALSSMPRAPLRDRAAAHFRRHLSFAALGDRLLQAYTQLVGGA